MSQPNMVDQVAEHVAQELIEMKSQSSTSESYLRESAAQVELLQLQAHDQAFHVHKPADLSAKDIQDMTGPAMHVLQTMIGYNSKPFYQDSSLPEPFTHNENFDHLAHQGSLQGASGGLHGDIGTHGNQEEVPDASNMPRVFIIDKSPEDGLNAVDVDFLQAPPEAVCESERQVSQDSVTAVEDAPSMFYVQTIVEANEAVKNLEKQTGSKYCAYKSTAGFGKTEYDPAKPHKIYFEERSGDTYSFGIPYDGIPFINIGKKVMDCQYGMDRCVAAKRRYMERHLGDETRQRRPLAQERTKKVKCKAQIRMKEVLKYPDFKVSLDSGSRKERVQLSRELREAMRNGTVRGEKRIYIQLPRLSDHEGHPLGENAIKQVKPCLSGKQAMKEVNALTWDAFIQRFGNVVEQGQVIASGAWSRRPFANVRALHLAVCDFLDRMSPSGKEAVFRCYPSLIAASKTSGNLSSDSATEFRNVGLLTLSPEETELLLQLNTKYRDTFHFSFVICMQETNKEQLLACLHGRIQNSRDIEILTAAEEVKKIAWYRILDRVRILKPK